MPSEVEADVDVEADADREVRRPPGKAKRGVQKWSRLIHVYTSMICFLVVFFFAATGITLNHPNWVLGDSGSRKTVSGALPSNWHKNGVVDWLRVSEYLRNEQGVSGTVGDYRSDDAQGSIAFAGPGYSADAFIDVKKSTFQLTIESKGFVAVMNDLHKGRDTGSSWKWLIDVSGGFLVLVSLSGIVLQIFLRKRRRTALAVAAGGAAALIVFIFMTVA